MPTITLTDPTTGTTVASGLVATNNSNLRALLNSGIDYVNLKGNPQLVSGETAVWNGTQFVRSSTVRINNNGQLLPTITTSTLASGPPTSPVDSDIWIATAVGTLDERWAFQYNAGTASPYKWDFIGGQPFKHQIFTAETTALVNTWTDTATVGPLYDTVRAGDYEIHGNCLSYNPAGASSLAVITSVNGVLMGLQGGTFMAAAGQNMTASLHTTANIGAAQRFKLVMQVNAGGNGWQHRILAITPIRIS